MGKMVSFKRPDGKSVEGYLAEPASSASQSDRGSKAPGVVVIQEWWGLSDQIKRVADRLAEAGYRALVPDLYRGKKTLDAKEAEHLMSGLDFADAASQDVRGAVQHLKATGSAPEHFYKHLVPAPIFLPVAHPELEPQHIVIGCGGNLLQARLQAALVFGV